MAVVGTRSLKLVTSPSEIVALLSIEDAPEPSEYDNDVWAVEKEGMSLVPKTFISNETAELVLLLESEAELAEGAASLTFIDIFLVSDVFGLSSELLNLTDRIAFSKIDIDLPNSGLTCFDCFPFY